MNKMQEFAWNEIWQVTRVNHTYLTMIFFIWPTLDVLQPQSYHRILHFFAFYVHIDYI